MNEFIDVAVPVGVRKTFAYTVPPEFRKRIAAGMRVLVPFGRKLMTGYVVGTLDRTQIGDYKLRAVRELLDPEAVAPPALVETALWVARYYFAPPGEVLRALFPAGTQVAGERRVALAPKTATLLSGGFRPPGLRPQEDAILDLLAQDKSLTLKELAARSGIRGAETWVDSLASGGWVQMEMSMETARIKSKEQLAVRCLDTGAEAVGALTPAQKRLYDALRGSREPLMLQEVLRSVGCTASIARVLERKGLVEIAPARIQRVPPDLSESPGAPALVLTASQKDVFDRILEKILQTGQSAAFCMGLRAAAKRKFI